MYLDDLPVYGFVGKIEKLVKAKGAAVLRFYLFTHFHFQILWNEDNIIESKVFQTCNCDIPGFLLSGMLNFISCRGIRWFASLWSW
jgi:hypothetical protein